MSLWPFINICTHQNCSCIVVGLDNGIWQLTNTSLQKRNEPLYCNQPCVVYFNLHLFSVHLGCEVYMNTMIIPLHQRLVVPLVGQHDVGRRHLLLLQEPECVCVCVYLFYVRKTSWSGYFTHKWKWCACVVCVITWVLVLQPLSGYGGPMGGGHTHAHAHARGRRCWMRGFECAFPWVSVCGCYSLFKNKSHLF